MNPMSSGAMDFSSVPEKPADVIFDTKTKYKADSNPNKLNLGVGAYRDDNLKPYVLNVVKKAETRILKDLEDGVTNKEYLPIGGDMEYCKLSQQLILGEDNRQLNSGCVAGIQTLSGTGSLRVLGEFVKLFFPQCHNVVEFPNLGKSQKDLRQSWSQPKVLPLLEGIDQRA